MRIDIKKRSGFTLIELLVVIGIIGILSTLATVALNSARLKARDAIRKNDMNQLGTAMQMYYNENNSQYPTTGNCGDPGVIAAAVNGPICSGSVLLDADGEEYFAKLPADPTNTNPQPSYYYDDDSDADTYCFQVNLESTADTDSDDWFICKNGACYPSFTNCDNDVGS